jgi:hypothetical protein
VRHHIIIPVAQFNRAVTEAVSYARSLAVPVEAVYVATNEEGAKRLQSLWEGWGCGVPLLLLPSQYREVIRPMVDYIEEVRQQDPELRVTVLLPEVVPRYWWQETLHNQFAVGLELALRHMPGVAITTVPVQMRF